MCFSSDQRVHIVITDNGCGTPESQLNEIFTPFVTFKEGGTGLGLAITREIIQAHSGNIYAEIESDGETSFHCSARKISRMIKNCRQDKSQTMPPTWAALSTLVLVKPKYNENPAMIIICRTEIS